MRGAASWQLALGSTEAATRAATDVARQCVVWLEVLAGDGSDTGGLPDDGRQRARCPYEAACRDRGRCFLPRRPGC
jgi:hypothetical protein